MNKTPLLFPCLTSDLSHMRFLVNHILLPAGLLPAASRWYRPFNLL